MRKLIGFVLISLVGVVAFYFLSKILNKQKQDDDFKNSDASKIKNRIKIGLDNYIGYYPIRSKKMQQNMLKQGIELKFVDDNANYQQRIKKIANNELDLAVFTLDSYILNGAKLDFPGKIVLIISESKGSDALVARSSIANIEELNNDKHKIAFTPNSPSHHLLKAIINDFDLKVLKLKKSWQVTTNGSEEALKKLLNGSVDAAVLWEPDIIKAMQRSSEFQILLSSKKISGLIIDVLVASDEMLKDIDQLQKFISQYFQTLKKFRTDKNKFQNEIAIDIKQSNQIANKIIDSVDWKTLDQNAENWFGIRTDNNSVSSFEILNSINNTVNLLVDSEDFKDDPLPSGGALQLVNSETVKRLNLYGITSYLPKNQNDNDILKQKFSPLDINQWNQLKSVAKLKIVPIQFYRNEDTLTQKGKIELDKITQSLKRYSSFRIRIEGHSSTKGDALANKNLSTRRANSVKDYLINTYGINYNRILANGLGGDKPLPKQPNQPYRSWLSSLSRVEIHFLRESY